MQVILLAYRVRCIGAPAIASTALPHRARAHHARTTADASPFASTSFRASSCLRWPQLAAPPTPSCALERMR